MDILIVDDDVDIRQVLAELLGDEGYQVAHASNGLEALTHLRIHPKPPRLILLDLNMPVMTGWKFREQQQQDPTLASIPTVIISAHLHLKKSVSTLNPAAYLEKPINFHALLTTVQQHCPP
jgi:CheY-like chemotaxis protein